ncbi:MAG: isopeptide-forming domain-containing fimbrial protein [Acidobacteriota bacterium]
MVLAPMAAGAQTPAVTVTPSLPAQVFGGESFCFTAEFSNTGAPGFGPYLLVILPPGISFDSASALGGGSGSVVGTFDGSGMLLDPISGSTVNGVAGGTLVVVTLPLGSVVAGGPQLDIEICATLDPSLAIGTPLDIDLIPAYALGDTPTGDNGPIVGSTVTGQVTPVLAVLEKRNTAPEGERPPGPSFPFEYIISLDIANGSMLDNVVLSDVLPAEIQWTGSAIAVTPASCSVIDPTSPPTPGGSVVVDCGTVVGLVGGPEIEVRIPVYVTDILDETACDTELLVNPAAADFDFLGIPATTLMATDADGMGSGLSVVHAAVQKSADSNQASPGETVTYTHAFQVSDFGDADSFVLVDVLPDGLTFVSTISLTIGGVVLAITPTVANDSPGPGQTTVTWDIGAVAGTVSAGSSGTLVYETTVDQSYSAAGPQNGAPLRASDPLTNNAVLQSSLTAGASGCSNTTAETVDIRSVSINKSIVAPDPLPAQFMPGESLTFRLTMTVPSGDIQSVQFVDFLPLPVFEVADFNPLTDATLSPIDTGDSVPAVSTDLATNSILVDWADVTVSPTRTVVLSIDLVLTVSDSPFADGLALTNIMQASSANTPGEVLSDTQPLQLLVGAPELTLVKGVAATSGSGSITPAPAAPIDSDLTQADAGDTVSYVITIENIGSEPAFQVTVTDTPPTGLTGCTIDSVLDGTGATLPTVGDLTSGLMLTGPLAENDESPMGGGPPFGTDTALVTVTCTIESAVQPDEVLTNTASATWSTTATATPSFPAVTDDASVTIAQPAISKVISGVSPGYQASAPFGNNEPVHIGELVSYTVTAEVPEGTSSTVTFSDQVDRGLAIVDVVSVTADVGVTTDVAGGFAAIASAAVVSNAGGGSVNLDRRLTLDFGTLSSAPDNDPNNNTVAIVYRAVVLNWSNNNRGDRRNNNASWTLAAPGGGTQQVRASAPNIRLREADLNIDKQITPAFGDAADTLSVSLTVDHNGASNADAFDVELNDVLPAGMTFAGSLVVVPGCTALPTTGPSEAAGTLSASWDRIDDGQTCTFSFDVTLDAGVSAGSVIENCASLSWESLRAADQPLAAAPANPLSAERTGDPADPGAAANIYRDEDCAEAMVLDVAITKTLLSTSEAHSSSSEVRPGAEDLTIGEELTFELIVQLPEGTTSLLVVTDALPFAPGVLSATAARVALVGGQITLPGTPSILLQDNNLGDGLDDTVVVDFGGPIDNTADGMLDDGDRIRIEIDAVVVDVVGNTTGDQVTNSALVQFGAGLDGGDTIGLDLVEPDLTISKVGSLATGDAGDLVTFTLRVEHSAASTADAFDVVIADNLPAELLFAGFVGGGLGTCSDPPDIGPNESSGAISATWNGLPRGAVCEIVFQATLAVSVMPGQTVLNVAHLGWRSLDTTVNAEERVYAETSTWPILITESGLVKVVASTDVVETEDDQKGLAEDLTIGEEVTFQATATFIDGTTTGAVLTDQLPNTDVVLRVVSSRIVSIGADLTVPNAAVSDPGDDCLPGCDANGDSERDQAVWDLGDVVNQPDGDPAPDPDDEIVIEVVAVVVNSVNNEGTPGVDLDQRNTVTLTASGVDLSATAPVDIVAPELTALKNIACRDDDTSNTCEPSEPTGEPLLVDAGDRVIYELVIEHTASSTAAAFGLTVDDLLPMAAGTAFVAGSVTAIEGVLPDTISDMGGNLVLSWNDPLALGTRYVIRYSVTIGAGAVAGETYPNEATLDWRSLEDAGATEVQAGTATDGASVTVFAPTIVKQASSDSLPRTGAALGNPLDLDLTIGELVTTTLTVVFSEGATTNVVVTDTSQNDANGLLAIVGASVVSLGNNITTSLPGTPVITAPDTVVFSFGTVTNAVDGLQTIDDTIGLEVTAQAVNDDDPLPPQLNVDGEVLTNTATLTFGAGSMAVSSATVDVVEPGLTLAKTMGPIVDGRVKVAVTATNNGTAPGYDLTVVDVLDETIFVPSSALPVMLPNGFELVQSSDGSSTTVTLRVAGDATMPTEEAILDPGESVTVMFTALLQGGAMPPVTTIDNTANATLTSLPGPDAEERTVSAMAVDQVLSPSLMITKTAIPAAAIPGQTVTFDLLIENMGDAAATGLVVFDTVPSHTTAGVNPGWFVAPAPSTTACNFQAAGTLCFTELPTPLGVGSNTTVSFAAVIDSPLATGVTMIANQAQVDSAELPPKDSNILTVPVTAAPDLTLAKSDSGATATPGGTVTYTLTYDNVGNQTATGVVVTETVPANTISGTNLGWEVSPVGSGTLCDGQAAGTVCVFSVGTVLVGGGSSVGFVVVVDTPLAAGVDQINNAASVADDGANGADPTPGNNTATESTPIDAAPDLAISKSDGGATATPGATVTYTLSYANNGTQAATGVVLTETVPANTTSGTNPAWEVGSVGSGTACTGQAAGTLCVLSIGTLAGGASASTSFAVVIDNPLPAGVTQVANTVSIGDDGSNGTDPTPDDNTASDTTPVTAAPDLSITKSDGGATVMAGDTVSYTLTYANNGNQEATGVVLTETVPAHTVSGSNPGWEVAPIGSATACDAQPAGTVCLRSIGSVPAGTGGSATFVVVVDDPLASGVSEVANTASIADDGSNGPDPTPDDNSDDDLTPVDAAPDLSINKDDGGASTVPGGSVTFSLDYANNGTQDATGVVLSETVPAHTTSGTNPGWEVNPVGSAVACNSQAAGTICVLAIGDLDVGEMGSATFLVSVDDPLAAGVEEISNAVTIADDGNNGPDPTPGDNSDDDQTPVTAAPDLNLSKDDGDAMAQAGDIVTYLLSYGNVGDQGATGVVLTETVPPNTTSGSNPGWEVSPVGSGIACDSQPTGTVCVLDIGSVPAGTTGAASFVVVIDDPLPAGVTQVANTASISDDGTNGPDPTPDDNTNSDTTPVDAVPDLQVSKDDGAAIATPGDAIDYTLSYVNVGTQEATGVVLTETVPADTTSGINPGWAVAPVGSGVACDNQPAGTVCVLAIGNLAGGDSGMAIFQVVVDAPKPAGVEEIFNTVSIADDGANGPDPTPQDNSDTEQTPADAGPDLAVSKDDGGATTVAGGTVVYAINYENVGTQNASGVVLTETVPANSTSGTNPAWEVSPLGSGIACEGQPAGTVCVQAIGALDVGASGIASFELVVDDPLPAGVEEISNTVTIADDGTGGPDQNPDNNTATDQTPVDAAPDLNIVKDDGDAVSSAGGTVTYTLSYANSGDQGATGVVLTEVVPVNTSSGSNPGWEVLVVGSGLPCDSQPAATVCVLDIGALAAGETGSASFELVIDDPLPAGIDQVANTVTIGDDGANGPDPTPDDNTNGDTTPVDAVPDLQVLKDDGGVTALPGGTITYTLTYTNVGTQGATGVILTEEVPFATSSGINPSWEVAPVGSGIACDSQPAATSCVFSAGSLAAGDTAMTTFDVVVDAPKPAGVEEITNTVVVGDDGTNGPDPTPENNTADEVTPASAGPDLAVTKDDGGVTTVPGGTVTYTISYENVGTQNATGVVLTETVPADTVTGVNPGWEVAPAGSAVPCDAQPVATICELLIGDLDVGESGSATFELMVDNPLAASVTQVSNTVGIGDDGSGGPDQDPSNNVDDDQTPVAGMPIIEVLKTAEQPSQGAYGPGDVFAWTVEVLNMGDQDAVDLTLVDEVPPEVLYVLESMELDGVALTDAVGDDAGSFDGTATLTVEIASLPAGSSVFFVFLTEVTGADPDDDGLVINQAVVTDTQGNAVPSDDPGTMDDDDPTVVPIVIFDIPTLSSVGFALLSLLLMIAGTRTLQRRTARSGLDRR